LYIGIAVTLLCALGVMLLLGPESTRADERRLAASVLITGGLALGLSFGPTPTGWSPFDLLSRLPGLSLLRAPARFALLVMMAAALLAAFGVVWLRRRSGRHARFAVPVLLALFFVESFVVAFPAGKPQPTSIPKPYEMLATLPRGAVLSLPSYRGTPEAFRESDYLLFSTRHWHSIVNGFGRQEPPRQGARLAVLATFPSSQSIAMMRALGVRYVVLHTRRSGDLFPRAEAARGDAAVVLLDSTDGDYLFEVR